MRIYGSIQTSFWANSDAQKLSDQGKLLLTYLFTGPHSNMLGCFRLPDGYITEDLHWTSQKVKAAFLELSKTRFVTRDDMTWVVIHNFLKWNPVQNPKQGKGIQKLFEGVPSQSNIMPPLIDCLLSYGKYFDLEFLNRLHSLKKTTESLFDYWITDKNEDKNQNNDQDHIKTSSLREDVQINENENEKSKQTQNCPHENIIALYHEMLPMCPKILVWNKTRRSYLKQRWTENPKHQTLDWWRKYFSHVKQSSFLTGNVLGRDGNRPFIADLEWLVRPNNFVKVIEGKYHGEGG
jgi:hypothetical protein